MKGLNHLVLAGHDLEAMRATYAALGFTVTPRAQHPFGTGNSVIQLKGCYLELLSVTQPRDVIERSPGVFSFSAFNRDFLQRREGFSMLVLSTDDAPADSAAWKAAGLQTYAPFEFARPAALPDGSEITIGFRLAYVTNPTAPWLGLFACQHFRPDFFEQPRFLAHANGATRVADVWIVAEAPEALQAYLSIVTGGAPHAESDGGLRFDTPGGRIIVATPERFEAAFGAPAPGLGDGPHLAGYTIACRSLDYVGGLGLEAIGERLVVPAQRCFGTALAFVQG